MASLNKVFLMGNLTRDPEVKYLPSSSAVTDLRLAVNRQYRTKDGENHEETLFVSVSVFGRAAENCGKYLRKGSSVMIEGRLRLDEWERDGQKQSRLCVTAENVQFLSGRGDGEGRPARTAPPEEGAHRPAAPESSGGVPGGSSGDGHGDSDDLPF